jgi:tetratricopeptide (TPR) repeat protein
LLCAATGAASVLVAVSSTQAGRAPGPAAFDPLFAGGAACAPARAGRPPLLDTLVLAQAETRPFQPGQQPPGKAPPAKAGPPPLYDDLGTLHVPITTRNPRAQAFFDQGMRLTFAFNHAEAARAFRAAQALDPACAMCYWGEALVLGPNINAPMFPEAVAPAVQAAATAMRLAKGSTPAEQALIQAVARRYSADPRTERAALDKAYADAMTEAAHAHPNNDTIQVLFAEALMDLAPWDYWATAGTQPKSRTAETVDALERVLERNPSHPGAAHYYIHTMEASAQPDKALSAARVLARQIPGAGHIVHMPSHIYYRLGMYREALQSNVEAVAIDEKYFSTSPSDPVYRGAYYPHNIHFVMVSALMGGDGRTTLDAAGKLDMAVGADVVKATGALQPVKSAPYFAHVQFSSPDVLVSLPDPGSDFVLVKAMWHYARHRLCSPGRRGRRQPRGGRHRPHRAQRRFQAAHRLGHTGARNRPDRKGSGARPHRRPAGQTAGRHRRLPRSRGDPGCPALHGTALLVLPGTPVARHGAAARRPARPGRAGLPHLAGTHPKQRLGAARADGGVPRPWRHRRAGGCPAALCEHLARQAGWTGLVFAVGTSILLFPELTVDHHVVGAVGRVSASELEGRRYHSIENSAPQPGVGEKESRSETCKPCRHIFASPQEVQRAECEQAHDEWSAGRFG